VRSALAWLLMVTGPATAAAAGYLTIDAVPPDPAATSLSGHRWTIYLDGLIDSQAAARLAAIIAQRQISLASVYLNSPGGSLTASMAIGRLLRAHRFHTHIGAKSADPRQPANGVCYSACPFAYAGGLWRFLEQGSVLGVHRASNRVPIPDEIAFEQVVGARARAYLAAMGVSPELFALMSAIPANGIRMLSHQEAARLALVNDGRAPPAWSIEDGTSGLRLRGAQETAWGAGEVVLTCRDSAWLLTASYSVSNAAEIAAASTHASIRIDDELTPLVRSSVSLASNGDVVGTALLDGALAARLRSAHSIGLAFQPASPEVFWGFSVQVGDGRETLDRYFAACAARSS